MKVKRIVVDIACESVSSVRQFYIDLFELDIAMDLGWIVTLKSEETAPVQLSIASEGGSGTPIPDMSVEVDDVDEIFERAKSLGCKIEYDLTNEPWNVRRFCVRDPAGKLVNVLMHL